MHGLLSMVVAVGLGAAVVPPVLAQSSEAQSAARDYSISAGTLGQALLRFGMQSGLQFSVDSKLTNGKRTAGIKGRYSTEDALRALLAGSGLTFRYTGPRTVVIEALPDTGDARLLGPLRIEGADMGVAASGTNGVNGSTDVTATEGTNSYTSGALSVGSKMPRSIKDTPQSVSVVTQQRMRDQNIVDFTGMMKSATGVSLVAYDNVNSAFYSRGFTINHLQIDGGAPIIMGISGAYSQQVDMALYDHAEILRGVDGLFGGYGAPGGVVSLTRKRPLDHSQVIVEAQAGSWNNARLMLDASEPLGFDGRLRGRLVLVRQDRDFFYKVANSKISTLYGIVEADLTPDLTVSGGVSMSQRDSTFWSGGLPRFETGADLHLPRDTCLCFPWNRYKSETKEIFARAEQQFGDNWSAKLNLTSLEQPKSTKYASVVSAVNPNTRTGALMFGTMNDYNPKSFAADLAIDGAFELLGQRQEIVFGTSYTDVSAGDSYSHENFPTIPVDIFTFDPYDPKWKEPVATESTYHLPISKSKQKGAYLQARLTFLDSLHLITGLRWSGYQFRYQNQALCTSKLRNRGLCQEVGMPYSTVSNRRSRTNDFSWPPSVSLSYDLSRQSSVYLGYTDIYDSQSDSLSRNREPMPPMTGSNVELGWKSELWEGKLNASVAAYRLVQNNIAVSDEDYPAESDENGISCCYRISGKSRLSRGLDAEISGEVLPGLQATAGYTFNIAKYVGKEWGGNSDKLLQSLAPKHLLKLWADYRFQQGDRLRGLSLGGGIHAQSPIYNSGFVCVKYLPDLPYCDYANGGSVPYAFTQGSYVLVSARAAWQIDPHWNLALNLDNLTDRHYYARTGDPNNSNWYGEPRGFMLTLRGSF